MVGLARTSLLIATAVVSLLAGCATDDGFDRARQDFVVDLTIPDLSATDRLAIGIHPTTRPTRLDPQEVRGELLVCPDDSVLMQGATVDVPPCRPVETDAIDLEATDGEQHIAIELRTRDRGAASPLRISYRQADGNFTFMYDGHPQVFTLTGPESSSPLVTNYGDIEAQVGDRLLAPRETVQLRDHSLSIEPLDEGETTIDIDWFAERAGS
jgi:hypothetical protein